MHDPLTKRQMKAGFLLLLGSLGACASHQATTVAIPSPVTHEGLLAALWVQTSGEYHATTTQTFRHATAQMHAALADSSWTAALEQEGTDLEGLPPAVVVDVDETVLDNVAFQAQMVVDDAVYTEELWGRWVETRRATAIPGAKPFADAAAAAGVTLFYVTNRAAPLEEATHDNLASAGFPIDPSLDVLLMKGENGWSSDKTARRSEVAKTHRILLLMGDDLNDFFSGARIGDPVRRRELAAEHAPKWGERWFVLPNPSYGSWEASLFERDYSLPESEKLRRRYGHLEPFE